MDQSMIEEETASVFQSSCVNFLIEGQQRMFLYIEDAHRSSTFLLSLAF